MKKLFGLAALMISLSIPNALAADAIDVRLGNSQVIGPVEQMATVIIGNTGIADATLGGGGTIILTGKMLGTTNLIVLDESGRELLSSDVQVVPLDNRAKTTVVILRGTAEAQTYACIAGAGCAPAAGAPTAGALASVAPSENATEQAAPTEETPVANPEVPEATSDNTDSPDSEELISLNP